MSEQEQVKAKQERRQLFFEILHGYIESDPPTGELRKVREQVDGIVDVIYRHRLRLCNRAGLDFEDRDLVGIVNAYDRLNSVVGILMYEQGKLEGELTAQK